ncbi:carbamoyl phosphate synthase large subunit [Flavivirga aquatica]|uniref:Carbamoyl phosphate synthase large subunit n=1 Tax=Flavivirga aquatica TaxID=1849968 RepID=A0A1E5TB60_9FLAO|nr:ATP-grasp domain-containing protein [Flavivirga aquatica]OEK08591.1 carbamoyl phosphate synthase large subunit [Flavivirga aquatica]
MSNILITSGGRRVSLVRAFKKELKKIFKEGKVIVVDASLELSAAAQIADNAFKVCKVTDKDYLDQLIKICIENNVKLIVPTIDTELNILSRKVNEFNKLGIQIIISNRNIIRACENKMKSKKVFKKMHLNTPKLYSKDNFKLPIFVKPVNGSGSNDNYVLKKASQISNYHLNNIKLLFFRYIDKNHHDEYTCDAYYDKSGSLKCIIPRKRIEIRAGEVSKGITKKNKLVDFFKNNASRYEGMRGCITIQCFMHRKTDRIIGIEINPRFGGGFPLSYLAGGNYPKWIIQEYLLGEEIPYYDDWENNLLMLRYDDEILVHDYRD